MTELYTDAVPAERRERKPKPKLPPRSQQLLHTGFSDIQHLYAESQLSENIAKHLITTLKIATTPITKVLSLGLGSISIADKGQTRRLKQLAILLSIRENLERASGGKVEVYAQDPIFTRADEAFLSTHAIRILRTSTGSSLGEASAALSTSTLVYSPFLTLEAYEQLLMHAPEPVRYLIGDDFDALREKWPKYSAERIQVEKVVRGAMGRYRRRVVRGEGFWEEGDGAFPLAMYAAEGASKVKARARM